MIFNEKSLIFDPCFCANRWVCEFVPKWPIKLYLGPVFQISQNPGNRNQTDHQRAWAATVVQSFFGPVQFGLQSFCGPRTGLLNTSRDRVTMLMVDSAVDVRVLNRSAVTTMTVPTPIRPISTCLHPPRVIWITPEHPIPNPNPLTPLHLSNALPNCYVSPLFFSL